MHSSVSWGRAQQQTPEQLFEGLEVIDLVDLTYAITETGSRYPTDPAPRIAVTAAAISREGKVTSGYTELTIRSHHGTHIDAPAHKIPDGKTIDAYDLRKFINPALLVDLTQRFAEPGSGYVRKISEDILRQVFTSEMVRRMREWGITALVFRTGYDRVIERGVTDDYNFPHFEKQAAEFLVNVLEKSGVTLNVIGIDFFSVDPKGTWDSPAHKAFLLRDILLVETLVHLEALGKVFGSKPFELVCLPIPYKGADAAQTRAFARAIPAYAKGNGM